MSKRVVREGMVEMRDACGSVDVISIDGEDLDDIFNDYFDWDCDNGMVSTKKLRVVIEEADEPSMEERVKELVKYVEKAINVDNDFPYRLQDMNLQNKEEGMKLAYTNIMNTIKEKFPEVFENDE